MLLHPKAYLNYRQLYNACIIAKTCYLCVPLLSTQEALCMQATLVYTIELYQYVTLMIIYCIIFSMSVCYSDCITTVYCCSSKKDIGVTYNPPDRRLMGKTIKMKFLTGDEEKWYKITVKSCDRRSGKQAIQGSRLSTSHMVQKPYTKGLHTYLPNDLDIDCSYSQLTTWRQLYYAYTRLLSFLLFTLHCQTIATSNMQVKILYHITVLQ